MGLYDDLKSAALAMHRLALAEKALAEQSAEGRKAITELRALLQDVRDRQIRIEVQLAGLDDTVTHRAQAAAMAAVTGAFTSLAQRIAVLELGMAPVPGGRRRKSVAGPARQVSRLKSDAKKP